MNKQKSYYTDYLNQIILSGHKCIFLDHFDNTPTFHKGLVDFVGDSKSTLGVLETSKIEEDIDGVLSERIIKEKYHLVNVKDIIMIKTVEYENALSNLTESSIETNY